MGNLEKKEYILSFLIFLIFIFSGCTKSEPSKETIATVNGEPIYLKDFKRELALRVKQNPSLKITPDIMNEMVDIMIDKKLIIQEAMKKNLAEEQRFIDTIQAFWGQTLIRDFIDYKNKETEDLIYVTNREIQDYYEKLKTRATFNIVKRTQRQDIDILMEKIRNGETIEWDTKISLSYEEVPSRTLSNAFELTPGEMGVFKEGNMFYLIYLIDKEPISVPPLEEVYHEIKGKIRERKQRQAFDEWLRGRRNQSNIKINKEILQKVNR